MRPTTTTTLSFALMTTLLAAGCVFDRSSGDPAPSRVSTLVLCGQPHSPPNDMTRDIYVAFALEGRPGPANATFNLIAGKTAEPDGTPGGVPTPTRETLETWIIALWPEHPRDFRHFHFQAPEPGDYEVFLQRTDGGGSGCTLSLKDENVTVRPRRT